MRKFIVKLLLLLPFVIVLCSWLLWLFQEKKPINAVIVDKTVLNEKCDEHRSFNWILDHHGYAVDSSTYYAPTKDYFGFFPLEDHKFSLKDFDKKDKDWVNNFSDSIDVLYYTDTYGIYHNEWYETGSDLEYSEKVYGGLSNKDYNLIKSCIDKKIPVITEFNLFASPTQNHIRRKTEKLLDIKWSGWTGRYFETLDTAINEELPGWLINAQLEQNDGVWDFYNSGIVFVDNNGKILILESKRHLESEYPKILTNEYGQEEYGIEDDVAYPFWFDITFSTDTAMKVVSQYQIFPNDEGKALMDSFNIPIKFPAIMMRERPSPVFYYSGDFCDNPISYTTRCLKGIEHISFLFDSPSAKTDRRHFFWQVYEPMMSRFMEKYTEKK